MFVHKNCGGEAIVEMFDSYKAYHCMECDHFVHKNAVVCMHASISEVRQLLEVGLVAVRVCLDCDQILP